MCTICSLTIEFSVEHPLALAVAVATRQAIDEDLLPEPPIGEVDMGQSRHAAVVLLTTLQQRLEQDLSSSKLAALPNFFVLMIESRTWGYFLPTPSGFDVRADPPAPRVEPDVDGMRDCIVIVSQEGAAALTNGQLTFLHSEQTGVLVVDGPDLSVGNVRSAFSAAYPVGRFSEFVCAEVA
ncbi:hypothetical protein HJB89_18270 [Rhizobium sp. NZLR8]|uniref:hypothetical protein n=1 Tax=Rhizobium sp. NZLR8 TaxID=2731104 RepID=UPI001C829ADD|nr:hypothetical protein [Rhizobium sp. NZLR8]MBX5159058.1 hypothetical protein [Rhizobium sp. NZLR8]